MGTTASRAILVCLWALGAATGCPARSGADADAALDADAESDAGSDADARADAESDADSDADAAADADARTDADVEADADADAGSVLVAVYDDTAEPDGAAWAEGLELIEAALDRAELAHRRLDRAALNGDPAALEPFDALIFGGGFAYPGYTVAISGEAKGRLREFVERGGVFVGICAGAYFACNDIRYEGESWADESGYDLDLFPGTCTGPLSTIASYPDRGVAELDLSTGHPAVAALAAEGARLQAWYAGGPWFDGSAPGVETLARYAGDPLPEAGEAAAVAVPRGGGVALLFGPHPEIADPPAGERAGRLLGDALRFALGLGAP